MRQHHRFLAWNYSQLTWQLVSLETINRDVCQIIKIKCWIAKLKKHKQGAFFIQDKMI